MSQNDCIGKTLKPWPILVDHYTCHLPATPSSLGIAIKNLALIGVFFLTLGHPLELKRVTFPKSACDKVHACDNSPHIVF
ncbi:hypothetical protein FXF08_00795 [Vibrio cholerae]|nr:hypothetical protein FXF08_00795 [Vibrio cholerae]